MKVKIQRVIIEEKVVPDTLEKFKGWTFTSGTTSGVDFIEFAKLFRNFVKNNLPPGTKLVNFTQGYYYVFGFIEHDGKFVFFSISDVRYFPNDWFKNILIRTAKYPQDYSGGISKFTTLDNFRDNVAKLF